MKIKCDLKICHDGYIISRDSIVDEIVDEVCPRCKGKGFIEVEDKETSDYKFIWWE